MDISNELREKLKAERLQQYTVRMFNVQMDMEAYVAVGDTDRAVACEKALADLTTAYKAIEAM